MHVQTDEEGIRRKKAATRTITHMHEAADEDSNMAMVGTVRAVGQTVVFVQLRQCFVVDLYARKYWQARREAQGARNKASTVLRAARQQAKAEAPAGSEMDLDPDASPEVVSCSLALDQVRSAPPSSLASPCSSAPPPPTQPAPYTSLPSITRNCRPLAYL